MAKNAPKLQMSRITKRFPGVLALDDVSIEAESGKIVGLVGVGIMFCLRNKHHVQPSILYKTKEHLSDDNDYIVITCGACFTRYNIARGQDIISTKCPNCGREARIST